jgi:2,3-dihydroxybenzoate decarboxylase
MALSKITLEEHFALPDTIDDSERYFTPDIWPAMRSRLVDIHEQRLAEMDRCGIELMILSLNAPAIQAVPNTKQAVELARRSNDYLAEQVAKNPSRFQGLAALAMQDPEESARELTRCVKELGFRGALVNGFSQVDQEDSAAYYDLAKYWPFWATVERLDVPFYLHPREPLASRTQHYEGHPWFLGAAWAFGVETAIHALRLMGSGLFDRYPKLQIILGHLGEGLPYSIWRVDHRLSKTSRGIPAKKSMAEYLRENFYLTTSGNFRTQTLIDALLEVGSDRILFSADYPFEQIQEAADWLEAAAISENDRAKIARTNAERLFRITPQARRLYA